jgi:glutamyl-tRNA synthetase
LERVGKSGAKFDPEKAKWFNQQYLRQRPEAELATGYMAQVAANGHSIDKDRAASICALVKEKAHFANEFWGLSTFFFERPAGYDEGVIGKRWNPEAKSFFEKLHTALCTCEWNGAAIEECFNATAGAVGMKPGQVMQLFRVLTTGQAGGPVLFEVLVLLGHDETVERIALALSKLP